jgi:hypothetical protein
LSDLSQFVQQEDALSLRLADRFHDPHCTDFSKLLNEQTVISRQIVGRWVKVIANQIRYISLLTQQPLQICLLFLAASCDVLGF